MSNISESVSWAHAETYQDAQRRIPEGIALGERKIVESNLVFWHQVNARVKSVGPFPPLKLFENAVQTFYSKTKPGVDGLTQDREVLATASASFKWEQMIATKGLQTCAHNAHVAFKLYSRKDDVNTVESFGDLSRFRARVGHVEGFPTFCFEGAMELLALANDFAATAQNDLHYVNNEQTEQEAAEATQSERKRHRLTYWNEPGNKRIRLDLCRHHFARTDKVSKRRWCTLCGGSGRGPKGSRGHRTKTLCAVCKVPLCVVLHKLQRKTCFELWHTREVIEPRSTPTSSMSSRSQSLS